MSQMCVYVYNAVATDAFIFYELSDVAFILPMLVCICNERYSLDMWTCHKIVSS